MISSRDSILPLVRMCSGTFPAHVLRRKCRPITNNLPSFVETARGSSLHMRSTPDFGEAYCCQLFELEDSCELAETFGNVYIASSVFSHMKFALQNES